MFVGLAIISKAGIDIFAQLCTLVQCFLGALFKRWNCWIKGNVL